MLTRILESGFRPDGRRLIEASGLFDADWYAARYPEVGPPERALGHFLKSGGAGSFDPGPRFSARSYLAENADVAAAGVNPLLHYLRYGQAEGRLARDLEGRPSAGPDHHGLGKEALARVRAAFDADFYHATNPDLTEGADAFEHYMSLGWRQGRDPARWFSTAHYRRGHPDLARSKNPFAHYVLTGCREGRAIAPSARRRHEEPEQSGRVRLAALAMVRNEADIIRAWAGHVLALFDEVVIVDHGSEDGTAEFLDDLARSRAQVTRLKLEEPCYIQSVTMTYLVRELDVVRGADWVFPLDADEFLPFPDRAGFEAALTPFARCPAITMRWRNLIPERYADGPFPIDDETGVLSPPTVSDFRKVAFQPSRLPVSRMVVAQGNHALLETANGLEIEAFEADFPLLHLPVRSADQMRLKLDQGVRAYRRMGQRRDEAQGTHWDEMRQALGRGTPDRAILNAMAANYSEPKDGLAPVSDADLERAGYRRECLRLAGLDPKALPPVAARGLTEMLMRLGAGDDGGTPVEDDIAATRLRLEGDRLIRADRHAEYARLPRREAEVPPDLTEALSMLLRDSYRNIDDLTPDDWAGHVPFMLALPSLLSPRRYVEVGTLRGTSFLAFAQAARAGRLDCETVAVSAWAVEPEREAEFADAYETFRFIAAKYAETCGILRMGNEAALARFEDGSIDVLHLDGLAGYDGARRTLDMWRPKLAEQGVVLIHDIHAHGPGFGVWRLWDELQREAACLEFRHDQGLGIACLGSTPPAALEVVARAAAADPGLRTLLQEHFERMGRLSGELFSRRYDMAQAEMRAASEGALTEELSWLKQQLEATRAEADALRDMVRKEVRLDRAG